MKMLQRIPACANQHAKWLQATALAATLMAGCDGGESGRTSRSTNLDILYSAATQAITGQALLNAAQPFNDKEGFMRALEEYVKKVGNSTIARQIQRTEKGMELLDAYGTPTRIFIHDKAIILWSYGPDKISDGGRNDDLVVIKEW